MRKFALVVAALSLVAACSKSAEAEDTGHIKVFAAASLQGAFDKLGAQFEHLHPGVKVDFDFAGSSDLAAQIKDGAPADVFASADPETMAQLGSAALEAVSFAANTLEIAVQPGNPEQISSLADMAQWNVDEVICAPQVPCGAATAKVAALAGVYLTPVSEEPSVTDVLAKVESGEADAGLVYATDVKAAGAKVQGVEFAEAAQAMNRYLIAALKASKHDGLARAFVAYVLSAAAQDTLAKAGFAKP